MEFESKLALSIGRASLQATYKRAISALIKRAIFQLQGAVSVNILSLVCTHDIGFQSIGDDDNDDDDDDDDNDDENVTRIPPGQVLF